MAMSLATPESIRRLQRKLYLKAKAEPAFRFSEMSGPMAGLSVESESDPGCVKTIFEARARNIDSLNWRRMQL